MGIIKPYHRLWRTLKDYDWSNNMIFEPPVPTLKYLEDNRFANMSEMRSLVTTAHLIIRDLYELFNYVEPNDANQSAFSHRIYELFLRTATEFESNCKGILKANGYSKAEKDMCIRDYFKIGAAARLSEYHISFERWLSVHVFTPFAAWNTATYSPLPWYQSYNNVKHNRFNYFNEANLGNLMESVAALISILHAQFGENMDEVCYEGIATSQMNQNKVQNGTFTINAPVFPEAEQYEFIWDILSSDPNPIQNYSF